MVKYSCETCQKTFAQKGHLEDHQNRKRPCKKENTIEALIEKKVQEALSKTNQRAVKIDTTPTTIMQSNTMDYSKKTREELIAICKEKSIKGYSGKKKDEIVKLLSTDKDTSITNITIEVLPEKYYRLNYIGSKFQLLEWITNNMKEKTGWTSFANKIIGDLFAGTGIVSYHFRKNMARVISNDAELYSSIITHAFTCSLYTEKCKNLIDEFQKEIQENKHSTTNGFITTHYSPQGLTERKFFTIENAKRIDYIRNKLETIKDTISEDEYKFILASILLSADAVSNVPAVYGCFLKNFKTKAVKNLTLMPIHNNTIVPVAGSNTYNSDVLNTDFISSFESDLVYLDPPYNERQYSKNYFPLNIIAKTPEKLLTELPLKGKTGIPTDCFISPFCKRGDSVEKAFDLLFRELKTKWVFLSYNSESIVSKEKMLDIMKKYGTASVIERDYKRFKSFEYNKDVDIKEYLFCLNKA
jgi:adenine-specific DNA-methyltransferase